jgi:hypothetical protein
MAAKDELDKAKELYRQDPYLGLEYYESIRGPADPTPQEWEEGMLREIARTGEGGAAK